MAMLPGDIGPALGDPLLPGDRGPQPPPTPAEIDQNKGLWRGFFDKLKTDNNFRQSVIMTGLGMMRSQQPGENAGDTLSQALGAGVTTLDLLRQRDRTQQIEDAELKRKADIEERGTKVSERGAAVSERSVSTAEKRTDIEAGDVESRWKQARAELDEAIRHNKSQEEIDRLRAKADNIRANAYNSHRQGVTGFQSKAMDAISEQLQAQGWDPIAADAMAAQRVQTTGKVTSPADRVRDLYNERVKQYAGSLEALEKPMTPEMGRQWLQEAIDLDKQLESLAGPTSVVPPGAGPGRTPTGSAGVPGTPPAASVAPTAPAAAPDPALVAQVQAALGRGVPVELIRQRMIEKGIDPKTAGL